jgi:hypothetical protein
MNGCREIRTHIFPHMTVGGKIMFYTGEHLNMHNFNFYFPHK